MSETRVFEVENEITTLSDMTEEILRVRDIKTSLQKDMKEVDEYLGELESFLLQKFTDEKMSSYKDTGGNTFSSVVMANAVIEDYDEFTKYVLANGRIDLFQKRVMQSEVQRMWDDGETVPGIAAYTKIGLRIRKG